jgi:hypothetical protein
MAKEAARHQNLYNSLKWRHRKRHALKAGWRFFGLLAEACSVMKIIWPAGVILTINIEAHQLMKKQHHVAAARPHRKAQLAIWHQQPASLIESISVKRMAAALS